MRRALAALALVAVAGAVGACERTTAQTARPAPPPVPVGVATAEEKVVPVQVAAVGTVQAFTTVAVKSQVAGQLVTVHFTEGDEVKPDQLLFTIDARPMEASVRQWEANVAKDRATLRSAEAALAQRRAEVTQTEANLARDLAQMENARTQEARYRRLAEQGLIARDQYDQLRTNALALQATVAADRAAVDNAKASARAAEAMVENARAAIQVNQAMVDTARIQLAYTAIRAPMEGRTGNITVQAGNVVKGNDDTPLVVIAQVRPIHVSFAVPEQYLGDLRKYRRDGRLEVEAQVDGGRTAVVGAVTFMNNAVDASTGTIQLKATFPNADHALWPGQFVDVLLTLTTERAIVVPTPAVQPGQKGTFVFVVKPDNTVESRPVKVGRRLAREVVIEQGLKPGERVVTDGHLRLLPGSRVDVKAQQPS
ncbi:MAG: efflux RND transporter periplasmic adaptor subunit [Candidatus Rokubacteria bacterium]|nr:efflux RND transporter periplasmic adaptor subunit [Candidatus Rokubacteria bacterium]